MQKRLLLLLSAALFGGLTACEQAQQAKNAYSAVSSMAKAGKTVEADLKTSELRQTERIKRGDTLAINYKELKKRLPAAIAGFAADGEAEGQSMQMSGLHYSTAKQKYRKGDETLTITLMDYNGAAPMFMAATMMMNTGLEMENDEQIMRGTDLGLTDVKAYETLGKKNHNASLMSSVADRFFVTVEATGQQDTELVKTAAKSLNLEELAKM